MEDDGLNLSHWPGNRTPAHLKADTTTEMALKLARDPGRDAWLAGVSARALGVQIATRELGRRFALTLVPVGLTMWVAHLLFHLLSGWDSVFPVAQRVLLDVGWVRTGNPNWTPAGMGFSGAHLLGIDILLLDAGLLLTLYAMWRTARTSIPRAMTALGAMLPWAGMAVALYCVGIWTFLQPMQMRGMMMH